MKSIIKTSAAIVAIAVASSAIVGFVNHGDTPGGDSQALTTTVTFENVSLTQTCAVIVDGEIVASIGPRQSAERQIGVGSHTIAYNNAETGERTSGERTVNISENEHLTVFCSYDG